MICRSLPVSSLTTHQPFRAAVRATDSLSKMKEPRSSGGVGAQIWPCAGWLPSVAIAVCQMCAMARGWRLFGGITLRASLRAAFSKAPLPI